MSGVLAIEPDDAQAAILRQVVGNLGLHPGDLGESRLLRFGPDTLQLGRPRGLGLRVRARGALLTSTWTSSPDRISSRSSRPTTSR